jgi:hypothetical protein
MAISAQKKKGASIVVVEKPQKSDHNRHGRPIINCNACDTIIIFAQKMFLPFVQTLNPKTTLHFINLNWNFIGT